jgi:predicted AAA+ superfamily ATPase
MIIIHHMNENTLPRLAAGALRERLRVMPAVIVSGARQAGKSTLVQEPVAGKRHYATLDDLDVCDLVRRDQEEQAKKRLRDLIEEGLASGAGRRRTKADEKELLAIARGEID